MNAGFNTLFERAWFGPFVVPNVYSGAAHERPRHPGPVYNRGPLDGPLSASIWAQRMAAIPLVNYAQKRMLGQAKICPPGQVAYQARGGIACTAAPSQMIGPTGTVGEMVPPSLPNRTFQVGPWWGNQA